MTIRYRPLTKWTDDRIDLMKLKWADGYSSSQIARILGGGISRSAVIGKLSRLGLAGGDIVKRQAPKPRFVSVLKPAVPPEPAVEHPPLTLADGKNVTILTVNDRMCRWPYNDPGPSFHFCGHAPRFGSPYCEFHARKAYKPHPIRRYGHGA